jgi:hypothetical protein
VARRTAAIYALGAAGLLALLFAWERGRYPNYAEGVYLFSARLIADGAVPYRDFVAAHPPLLFYSGAGVLGLWDSIDAIRIALSLVSLATGGLVAACVWRLTASAPAAVAGGLLSILAPWSLHEHALLTPETFGAPLLLGAALLAARRETATWAGVLGAVAIGYKWPFLLPGLAVAVVAPGRWRMAAALLGGFAAGVLLSFALFGAGRVYDDLVVAQQQIGWHSLHETGGLAVQAAWNLVPLVVPALAALWLRRSARDPALLRTVLALAAANLVLIGTITKTGTYLNTVALAEPPLMVLAAVGTVWLLRAVPRHAAALAAVGAVALLGAVQAGAFLLDPAHPGAFVRPGSAPAHAWTGRATVDRALAAARRCPPGAAYSGSPYVGFLAGMRMPGDEPDQFLMAQAPIAAPHAREAVAEPARCP